MAQARLVNMLHSFNKDIWN